MNYQAYCKMTHNYSTRFTRKSLCLPKMLAHRGIFICFQWHLPKNQRKLMSSMIILHRFLRHLLLQKQIYQKNNDKEMNNNYQYNNNNNNI